VVSAVVGIQRLPLKTVWNGSGGGWGHGGSKWVFT
jgi:hypothetical protein